ncbi:hypothetical protein MmarC5_1111 [Methanococcus maripaludis C5]|uniref:Uncharacterized protein n=1 Tax=Methanococcus maripaludis (strain C5 / ATCC BAA-1333) TaxID=402880 RepID=A4FYX9_METM5|nr:hypothetical protein [Methanococcus maripaludis]ABO35413.1 hypothetical protein MmarC5_1111 [Methanococcus maripaludis C5]
MENRNEVEKLEEIIKTLEQLRIIYKNVHIGEIPEDAEEFWGELELATGETAGILLSYDNIDHLIKTKDYLDFLELVRMKNLKNLAEKINLEDYPQMHLNYLFISHAIGLLQSYSLLVLKDISNNEI